MVEKLDYKFCIYTNILYGLCIFIPRTSGKVKNLHVICNFVFPGFDLRPDQEDHPKVSTGLLPNGHCHRVTDGHRNGGMCSEHEMGLRVFIV